MDSNRDIVMRVREALDYQAAAQAGRNPNERRPLADVLAEQIPGELIPGLRETNHPTAGTLAGGMEPIPFVRLSLSAPDCAGVCAGQTVIWHRCAQL